MENLNQTKIVDTHCHLWRKELSSRTWLTPDFKHLFRTFGPEELTAACGTVGIHSCVVIEAGKTLEENKEIQRMAMNTSLIGAFVSYVNLKSKDLAQQLNHLQEDTKFRGVRMGFEGNSDPDILKRSDIIAGLKEIESRGLIFEFLVQAPHLKDILYVYEQIPQLKGIIEHLGKPDMSSSSDFAEWQQHMQLLAQHTNINCKLSLSPRVQDIGVLLNNPGQGWPSEQIKIYVDFLIEHFGYERLMWGSDWPICLLTADYYDTWHVVNLLVDINADDKAKILGQNAIQFYCLKLTKENSS